MGKKKRKDIILEVGDKVIVDSRKRSSYTGEVSWVGRSGWYQVISDRGRVTIALKRLKKL